ncbi:MAG: DUF4190 domain-containing protein [Planctomycetes bacterium]|nr:DUF4190 domain-containing protein [Planctomycetota bacterium]
MKEVHVKVETPRKGGASLGISSLVLGILGLIICWIPILGMLGMPLSGLGILLGIVGLIVALIRGGAGIGFSIGGLAVSALAFGVALTMTAAVGKAVEEVGKSIEESNRTNQEIVGDAEDEDSPTPAVEWAPASSPVRQGDVQVEVTSAVVQKIAYTGMMGSAMSSDDPHLAITIRLTNLSTTKKLTYLTWAGGDMSFERDYATVADDLGNDYDRKYNDSSYPPKGRTSYESVYPEKSTTDVLIFEPPIKAAKELHLEMPAKRFGGEGMIRIAIPMSMVEWREG